MRSSLFLPIFLFLLLLVGGSFYYVCKIKQVCPSFPAESNTSDSRDPLLEGEEANLSPLMFHHNSEEPIISDGFDELRQDLVSKLGERDTLVVIGTYLSSEDKGDTLGTARAQRVRSLFVDHFDSGRIMVRSLYNQMVNHEPNDLYEAVQFNIVSGNIEEVDTAYVDDDSTAYSDENETTDQPLIEERGDKIIIHFPSGSVRKIITPEIERYIDKLVEDLKSRSSYKVYVVGHSDNEGDEATNYQLGRKRAWALKKLLWDRGLEPIHIITSSKGELEPLKSNDTEEGRAFNRRVELTIETTD
ncbi:MAG: OmpA family protein [Bacteroidia bacterium]|nr:OmpA family protein [Bacteroidia bacterium]